MKITLFKSILLTVFGLSAVIGIVVFSTYSSSRSKSGNTIGTVVIWGTLPKTSMQGVLAKIAQTNQSLKGVSYVQKNETTLANDLASAIATGQAPDLILASQEELHSVTKLITPISFTTLPATTFSTSFIEEAKLLTAPLGAGYYGVPFLVDPLVLFSNSSILSSQGIVRPPATWEALTGLVPNIALLTPNKQVTRGLIALGTYNNIHNARAILSSLFLQAGAPMTSYAHGSLSADLHGVPVGGISPGKAVLGFYTQFADPSKTSYTWNDSLPDSQQAFQNGTVALYLGFASEANFFTAANPNLNFSVSPLPQPATASTKSAYGLLYSFMIPLGAKNASGGYQVAALFTNSATQAILANALGLTPAALSALTTTPSDPITSVAYAEALYTEGWLSPSAADTDAVFSSMISNMINGRLVPDVTLSTAENALTTLLQK